MSSDPKIAIIISVIAALGAAGSGWFASRQSSKATEKVEKAKEIAAEKAQEVAVYKTKVDTETKRIDQVLDAQQKLLDRQDRQIVRLEGKIDQLQSDMTTCIDERGKFKLEMEKHVALYTALEAQMKGHEKFIQESGG